MITFQLRIFSLNITTINCKYFQIEYENDAETLVSHLQYQPLLPNSSASQSSSTKSISQASHTSSGNNSDDDDSVDQELKLVHIEMYKMKLRERERRRRVAREHQLVNQFFRENPLTYDGRGRAVCSVSSSSGQKSIKKSSSKDGSSGDVMEKLKILAEFQGVSEYQVFMANMTKEREVKQKIKDLMRYRRYGIKSLSESLEYETKQRSRRLNRKRTEKMRSQQKSTSSNLSRFRLYQVPFPEDVVRCHAVMQALSMDLCHCVYANKTYTIGKFLISN